MQGNSFFTFRGVKLLPAFMAILFSCAGELPEPDAWGYFETREIMVSPETAGRIMWMNIGEGDRVDSGSVAALIDTSAIALKLDELDAGRRQVYSRLDELDAQLEVQKEQARVLQREKSRIDSLLKEDAATRKDMDDIKGEISVLERQMDVLRTKRGSVKSELEAMDARRRVLVDRIERSFVKVPSGGVVLTKYAEAGEMAGEGKPLFKTGDLDNMYLRVYVSGRQLAAVETGEKARVFIDCPDNGLREYEGRVTWISEEAEFTPKIIQTREERVNLVYAVKIHVENDGALKVGMPGEAIFATR